MDVNSFIENYIAFKGVDTTSRLIIYLISGIIIT